MATRGKKHWTQTPAGRAKMKEIAAQGNKTRAAKKNGDIHSNGTKASAGDYTISFRREGGFGGFIVTDVPRRDVLKIIGTLMGRK